MQLANTSKYQLLTLYPPVIKGIEDDDDLSYSVAPRTSPKLACLSLYIMLLLDIDDYVTVLSKGKHSIFEVNVYTPSYFVRN